MSQYKIVFGIITNENDAFNCKLEDKWRIRMQHYCKLFPNIKYYFLKCRPFTLTDQTEDEIKQGYFFKDDNFFVDCEESLVQGIGRKTMKFFELMNESYDFIVRPNISSVILVDRLMKYMETAATENFYSGSPEPFGSLIPKWAFGACFIVSKDVALKIVQNQDHIVTFAHQTGTIEQVHDDVYIGFLVLQHLQIPLTPFKCIQILGGHDVLPSLSIIKSVDKLFHIRIKFMNGQRDPVEVELQEFLNSSLIKVE
jgi:hypothetical protein